MSDTPSRGDPGLLPQQPSPKGIWRFIPNLRSRWWTALLGLSLMANFLVGGLALGHRFGRGGMDRLIGISAVQLLPRSFFADLPRERSQELLRIVRNSTKDLRGLRDGSAASILKLASALESETYNATDVRASVEEFSTGNGSLAARGSAIILDIISRLNADERKALAAAIRDRAANPQRRRKN